MSMKQPIQPFDWERILIHDFPWLYLGEVALRTVIMFTVLLLALTVSGKREVKQLSVYELVLLIGLGSAAGDPMFYDDVPISAAIVVFVLMMGYYIRPGLPIMPHLLRLQTEVLVVAGSYACTNCGNVQHFDGTETKPGCQRCGKHSWVKTMP